jgi:hypothetical protein
MAQTPQEGLTSLILVAGRVHLLHARQARRRASKTLCGAALNGTEPSGRLDQYDAANLYAFNVCPCCVSEYKRKGHFVAALTFLSEAASRSHLNHDLVGQLPLFEC